jgi:hypothetical protein
MKLLPDINNAPGAPQVLDCDALTYLQAIYQGKIEAEGQRMRAAIAALPFERPKLSVAVVNHHGMASALEAAHAQRQLAPQSAQLELEAKRLDAEGSRS